MWQIALTGHPGLLIRDIAADICFIRWCCGARERKNMRVHVIKPIVKRNLGYSRYPNGDIGKGDFHYDPA